MGYLTYGHLHLTAARIGTSATIDELRAGMREHEYSGFPPAMGWGGIKWRAEDEDPPRLDRTNPGAPTIEDFGDYRVLLARLYVDHVNRALQRSVGVLQFDEFAPNLRFNVQAVDVAVIEGRSLYAFIASHDEKELKTVLDHLKIAAPESDDWAVGPMPKLAPGSDLYLWLLHRWHAHGGHLTPTLKLVEFNTLSTRDNLGHLIRSLRGIDMTRVDTLGATAEAHQLGPSKFVLYDKEVGLRADLFLLLDGTFDVHREGTEYDLGPLSRPLLGINAALDVATRVLPRLHNAHVNDRSWPSVRPTFVDECRQVLSDRFR